MSALGLNDHGDPSSLSYYAPRRRGIAADGSSIRPVLARLRRKEGDHPLVESVPLMPDDEPLGPADGADARTRLLLIGARFAAVVALCAGTTTVAYFMQARPQQQTKPPREDRAAVPAAAAPKPVQTVSFKSQARLGDASISPAGPSVSAAETKGQPLRDSAAQVADGREIENSAAVSAPLMPLGAMPAVLVPAGWSPAAAETQAATEVETTGTPAKEHEPKEHHAAHSRHHYRHHRVARVSAPPQPAADTASAQPAQPSLTDLLRKIFKSSPADQTSKPDAGAIQ